MRKLIHGERQRGRTENPSDAKAIIVYLSRKQTCPRLAIPQYLKTSLSSVFIPEHDNL